MDDEQTRPAEDAPDPGASDTAPETADPEPLPGDAEVPEVPALDDGDEDPDSLAGDFTDPDVDVPLAVQPDEDGE